MLDEELMQLCKTDSEKYVAIVIENEKKLKAVGAPWLNRKRYIPSILESLKYQYKAGIKTLQEVAIEFCRAGWTNYIDIEFARQKVC